MVAVSREVPARIALPGGPLHYTLRRSARARRLRIMVDPERGLIVTVPLRGSGLEPGAVDRFLAEREAWIRRHLEVARAQRAAVAERGAVEDGATVLFRGRLHRIRVLDGPPGRGRSRVTAIEGDAREEPILLVRVMRTDRRPLDRVLIGWFRERAREAIEEAIRIHGPALDVEAAAVTLRDQRSRWGSATRTRRLSFSWRLVLAPPEALETVVIHELAHLRVFGHGPRFWAVVASRRADHAAWRRWLRDHAVELRATARPATVAEEAIA